jgi:hypothetical protein
LNAQPEIGLAPYSKSFKIKVWLLSLFLSCCSRFSLPLFPSLFACLRCDFQEKYDKYLNTYEQDPEFIKFRQRFDNPEAFQQQQQQLQVSMTRFHPFFSQSFGCVVFSLENCCG